MTLKNSISLVMPYWRRPEALSAQLKSLRALYPPELEIIVVDDGSHDFWIGKDCSGMIFVHLPVKDVALNPCVPFNYGVAVSSGEFIVLTNPEVRHTKTILTEMMAECERLGPNAYVAAACWSPAHKWWFCHSTLEPHDASVGRAPKPKGAGFHFCSMLRRSLYDRIGGFSEEYRDGQGYEDNDLLWKLERAGTRFKIMDDLVTEHVECPRCEWPKGGHERNRLIYERKWNG